MGSKPWYEVTGHKRFPNDRCRVQRNKVMGMEKVQLLEGYPRRPAKFLHWAVGSDWPSCNWRCAGEASGAGIEQLNGIMKQSKFVYGQCRRTGRRSYLVSALILQTRK
jgi:hypothetical protein